MATQETEPASDWDEAEAIFSRLNLTDIPGPPYALDDNRAPDCPFCGVELRMDAEGDPSCPHLTGTWAQWYDLNESIEEQAAGATHLITWQTRTAGSQYAFLRGAVEDA